jgi:hypothetical protein
MDDAPSRDITGLLTQWRPGNREVEARLIPLGVRRAVRWPAQDDGLLPDQYESLIALDEALNKLAEIDVRQSRVVELRFSRRDEHQRNRRSAADWERTVEREWASAQA